GVRRDAMRRVELARLVALFAPGLHPVAVLVVLRDSGVDIAVADEDVALRVPGDVGWLPELTVHVRPRRIHTRPRLGFVRCLLLAAKYHRHTAGRVELDDHVRTLVHGPDVVVPVD